MRFGARSSPRSGNTRVVAGLIQRDLRADLFEIRPHKPYPDDYLKTVEQARQERDSGFEPALESKTAISHANALCRSLNRTHLVF